MIDIREYLSSTTSEPKRVLKVVVAISILLLITWLVMVSRMDINGGVPDSDPAVMSRVDSLRTSMLPADSSQAAAQQRTEGSPGVFLNAFTTFIILMAILTGVWLWIRKSPAVNSRSSYPEIRSQMLGQGAQLKVLQMHDEIWVLGVTTGSVQLLRSYSVEEWQKKGGELPSEKRLSDRFMAAARVGGEGSARSSTGSTGSAGSRSGADRTFRNLFDSFKGSK